jgi:hypothetical protein
MLMRSSIDFSSSSAYLWAAILLCSTPAAGQPDPARHTIPSDSAGSLPFLAAGTTKRQEITALLGEPSARYSSDGIVTYRLQANAGAYRSVARQFEWHPATHSLVLQFDEHGVLLRHALIRVR